MHDMLGLTNQFSPRFLRRYANLYDSYLDAFKQYVFDVKNIGLEKTWDDICQYVVDNSKNLPSFLNIDNFGELYEIGLEIQDKISKKNSGQYYTPDDVALVMSKWLEKAKRYVMLLVALVN